MTEAGGGKRIRGGRGQGAIGYAWVECWPKMKVVKGETCFHLWPRPGSGVLIRALTCLSTVGAGPGPRNRSTPGS